CGRRAAAPGSCGVNVGSAEWGTCRCGGKTFTGPALTGGLVRVCASCGTREAVADVAPPRPRRLDLVQHPSDARWGWPPRDVPRTRAAQVTSRLVGPSREAA